MKKIFSIILAAVMLFALSLPGYSQTASSAKEEAVYGILNSDGSVNNIYVVNAFNGGKITDYGIYSEVHNLTTTEKLVCTSDQISIDTSADKLYYQGTLKSKELPWNIVIKYTLDAKQISASELAGKSGKLEIAVTVTKNTKVNETFFNNFALQITIPLEKKLCENIKADGATIADAGSKKQLSYTILPGKGADLSATADVHDFEMDAITINCIKLSLDLDIDYKEFTSQLSELTDALNKLDDGAGDLLDGAKQLSDGMQKYVDGLKTFKDGLLSLQSGTDELNKGASALSGGLSELIKQNDALVNGAIAIQQATFDAVNANLAAMNLGLPTLTPENYSAVLSPIPQLASVKAQLDGAVQFTQGLKSYTSGVAQLSDGASSLAQGTAQFKASAAKLVSGANELYNSGAQINTAVKKLRDGLAEYKDGTKKLTSGTSDIDKQVEDKIDDMLNNISGNSDEAKSFVSDKNTNITAVQFVLKTQAIEMQETDNTQSEKPVELNFWQKLLKLFGLYK